MTVVTMPHAKAIKQIPARLVFDSTISVIDAGAGDETGVIPPIREIRSVRYPGIPTGTASNLFCGAGVGVAPLLDWNFGRPTDTGPPSDAWNTVLTPSWGLNIIRKWSRRYVDCVHFW